MSESWNPGNKSVSFWLQNLKGGDAAAGAQALWDHFFERLLKHIESRVRRANTPQGMVEPEDVTASVFESLWRGAQEGRFAEITNRDDLWWQLLALSKQKVANHIRREMAQKRFPGHIPLSLSETEEGKALIDLISEEPTPEFTAICEEECERLLGLLRDDVLRQIAVYKLQGYKNSEICEELNISSATVTRKLGVIRRTWASEL